MSIQKTNSSTSLIYKVQFLFADEIEVFTSIGLFAAIITLASGKSWKDFYGSPSSIKLNDPSTAVSSGNKHDQSVQLSFPGNDPVTHGKLCALEGRQFVLCLFYQDGSRKIVGHPSRPALIKIDYVTENSNYYPITFKCSSFEGVRYLYDTAEDIPAE